MKKIGFIGVGAMNQAIIKGLLLANPTLEEDILLSNRNRKKAENFASHSKMKVVPSNIELVQQADIIFLGVKPYQFHDLARKLIDHVKKETIIVSMLTKISIEELEKHFSKDLQIIRIMPNLACQVIEGITMLTFGTSVKESTKEYIKDLLSTISFVDEVHEEEMELGTVLSGSSPAFIAMFMEALADGAVDQGMNRKKAYLYLSKTLQGTGKLLESFHPGELKDLVSSPSGLTIRGVKYLEEAHFRSIVLHVLEKSMDKE